MSMKIATRSSQGLRAQASGGQTVLDVYQTIDHYVRRTLSAAHADLFAEPNVSGLGGDVDWYTPIESAAGAQELSTVPEPRRGLVYARLAALINDIRNRAGELKNSAKQSDRLLGQLLLLATEVPGEEFVYAVGDQPVLIFWGHLRDVPIPQGGVIDRMIARHVAAPGPASDRGAAVAVPPVAVRAVAAAEPAREASSPPPASTPPPTEPPKRARYFWVGPALWVIFIALGIAIGLELLSACGIGSPFGGATGSLWINYCPVPTNSNAAELNDLEAQNKDLQSQLDRLLGNVAGRRAQCAETAGPAKQPPPPPPPPPPKEFTMPKTCQGRECLAFLKGCWSDEATFMKRHNGQTTEQPDEVFWKFDEQGEGRFYLRTKNAPQITCQGPIHAQSHATGEVDVEEPQAPCNDGTGFQQYDFSCSTDSKGETTCEADNGPGEPKNRVRLHPRACTDMPDE